MGQKGNAGRDTRIYICNPQHYTPPRQYSRGGHPPVTKVPAYDHRRYIIDIPAGQDINENIARAMAINSLLKRLGFDGVYTGNMYKYNYLHMHVDNGTAGDYGKNANLYRSQDPQVVWQRRLGANFNYGAMAAALGYSLDMTLLMGNVKSYQHAKHSHPREEQDAIEDGYWYFYATHPASAKHDGVTIPKGYKFGR